MSSRLRIIGLLALALGLAAAPAAAAKPITKPRWLARVSVTEYFAVPEAWFVGKRVAAAGVPGEHRVDWLYSARGVSMEGDGIGLDGVQYHVEDVGRGGWVNANGGRTVPHGGGWSNGGPFWRAAAYWKNSKGTPTFPLEIGDWFAGEGVRFVPVRGQTFGVGQSRPLTPYRSVAVDPDLIKLGSRVYIPAYKATDGGGWFQAADVGGAIIDRHVDVYRTPPESPDDPGQHLRNQRILVVPPGTEAPPVDGG